MFPFPRQRKLLKNRGVVQLDSVSSLQTSEKQALWEEMLKVRGEAAWNAQGPARGVAAMLRLIAERLPSESPSRWLKEEAEKAELVGGRAKPQPGRPR